VSKKEKREERLIRGDELLEQKGVDLDAPDTELLEALVPAIGAHPDSDLSIADLLGSIATQEAVARLHAWEATAPADKDLLRVIRRSLFRLQQRGLIVPEREKPRTPPARLADPVVPTGYLSPLDGAGNRFAWLVQPRPEGGVIMLTSLINDRAGMRHIASRLGNKTQFKEALADVSRDLAPLAAAPHLYVDWLMSEAYQRGVPRGDREGGYPLLRSEFYAAPATVVPSPVQEMMRGAGDLTGLLKDSAKLFEDNLFDGWALPDDLVKVHQARFRDAQDSTIVVSSQAMGERLSSIMDQAFEEVFETSGSWAREVYGARMQEMALWYLLASPGEPHASRARICYAVHQALADPSASLEEISFLRILVLRSFAHLLPESEREQPEEKPAPSSLIVPP